MTSSNLVGVSTGCSLGREPRRILLIKNRGRTMKQAALRPESYTKKVALVLQGGGALGSYQAGVYEALASSDYKPDWVAGISIGAINAALIAGNSPEMRVEKLRGPYGFLISSTARVCLSTLESRSAQCMR